MPFKDKIVRNEFLRRWNIKRRANRRAFLVEAKSGGCVRPGCLEKEICALGFHHRDPEQKEFTIGDAMNLCLTRLRAEIAKCVVLCHNDHAKLHAGLWSLPTEGESLPTPAP